jgi:hypothetical protein
MYHGRYKLVEQIYNYLTEDSKSIHYLQAVYVTKFTYMDATSVTEMFQRTKLVGYYSIVLLSVVISVSKQSFFSTISQISD